jgi:alkanesulfonate monooxygenase SsuD/methylene tetrahydromethanopterin reductase-like flavin-dependent oxidoreductase (luciferase family)
VTRGSTAFSIGSYSVQSTYVRPRRHPYLFREAIAEATAAEELGFDCLWLGQHHFSYDGYCPSPLPALAHIASGTDRIAVGAGVMLFALHTATEVASQCRAFQDAFPARTIRIAVASGYVEKDFMAHRVEYRRRGRIVEEQLDVLLGELGDQFGDVELWMGGTADRVIRRAARYGASLLLTPDTTAAEVRRIRDLWESELVPRRTPARVAVQREVWPDSDPATRAWYRARLKESWKVYGLFDQAWDASTEPEGFLDAMADLAIVASPAQVVDELGQLLDAGADEIDVRIRCDGTSHGQALANLERLATDVIPQLRKNR